METNAPSNIMLTLLVLILHTIDYIHPEKMVQVSQTVNI